MCYKNLIYFYPSVVIMVGNRISIYRNCCLFWIPEYIHEILTFPAESFYVSQELIFQELCRRNPVMESKKRQNLWKSFLFSTFVAKERYWFGRVKHITLKLLLVFYIFNVIRFVVKCKIKTIYERASLQTKITNIYLRNNSYIILTKSLVLCTQYQILNSHQTTPGRKGQLRSN